MCTRIKATYCVIPKEYVTSTSHTRTLAASRALSARATSVIWRTGEERYTSQKTYPRARVIKTVKKRWVSCANSSTPQTKVFRMQSNMSAYVYTLMYVRQHTQLKNFVITWKWFGQYTICGGYTPIVLLRNSLDTVRCKSGKLLKLNQPR